MKKILVTLLVLVLLLAGGFLAIGFLAEPKFDVKHVFIIDAPPEKVWAIVSTPERVTDWMPIQSPEERITAVKRFGAAAAAAAEGASAEGVTGTASRHTYVHQNGLTSTVEVTRREVGKVYEEHVVEDMTGMASIFPDMSWGFEMAPADGGKTRLTPFMRGVAAKPMGTFMNAFMGATGMARGFQETMAKNVETLAKGGTVPSPFPAAPAAAPAPAAK